MNTFLALPSFTDHFPFLEQFILELVDHYQAGKINSWKKLDKRVKRFFTPEKMEQMEGLLPGWKKMSSYSKGITRTHVICVFLGVHLMPEFQALKFEEQEMIKWIVLFHDIDKFHIRGKKDTMHAFRSGVLAAHTLPKLGFPITKKHPNLIHSWSEDTRHAFIAEPGEAASKPNNQKLPKILMGIDQLFGENTPASLITKTVLLHISLAIDPTYPTPAPLTDAEIKRFITPTLLPILKVMMMGDNEGWALFDEKIRKRQYRDALKAFEKVERIIGENNR